MLNSFSSHYDRARSALSRGLFPALAASALTSVALGFAPAASAQVINAQDPANFRQLDVNIYWYGPNNQNQRAIRGQTNPYFNPSRPTIIYIHGWQKDTTVRLIRENFNRLAVNDNADVARPWIDRGWNVGIFYWNQLADENEVKDAEAKIHTSNGTLFTNATRWRDSTGAYRPGPALTVTQQFVNAYKAAMANYTGPEVRLAGHSLGAQLAITGASALWREKNAGLLPPRLVPTRVALLDHAFLRGPHAWIGNKWTGQVARELVSQNRSEIIYENYRTSAATSNGFIGDANQGLIDMTPFVEVIPAMYGSLDFNNKHVFAVGYYFAGMGLPAMQVKCNGYPVPSAALSNSSLRVLAIGAFKYSQLDGTYTKNPSDDTWDELFDQCDYNL
jgi:hypothetical protein